MATPVLSPNVLRILTAGVAVNAAGAVFVPINGRPQRNVQANLSGTGALTATVLVKVSLDGINFATVATLNLSGTGADSQASVVVCEGVWVQTVITVLTGTGASVNTFVS